MKSGLHDRVAVITGAASGIGLALALRAAREGMSVALVDIEQDPLSIALAQVRSTGATAIASQTDVSDARAVRMLQERVQVELGPPWLVCNNAGVNKSAPSWALSVADWQWVLGVNFWGVVNGICAFAPGMIERDCGHIVNVASAAGLLALPGAAPYVASKHAVVGLSECLYRELEHIGSRVGVTVVCPKFVATNIATSTRNQPQGLSPARSISVEAIRRRVPAASLTVLRPEELADDIFDAISGRRFWLLTQIDEVRPTIWSRWSQALDGRNPDKSSTDETGSILTLMRAGLMPDDD